MRRSQSPFMRKSVPGRELKRDINHGRFLTACRGIEPASGPVGELRSKPGLAAAERSPMGQQRADQLLSDSLSLAGRCDAHLVYPELGRLVRMHVVHPGGEADYQMIIERHHEVMARITQEFGTPLRRNHVVEDV